MNPNTLSFHAESQSATGSAGTTDDYDCCRLEYDFTNKTTIERPTIDSVRQQQQQEEDKLLLLSSLLTANDAVSTSTTSSSCCCPQQQCHYYYYYPRYEDLPADLISVDEIFQQIDIVGCNRPSRRQRQPLQHEQEQESYYQETIHDDEIRRSTDSQRFIQSSIAEGGNNNNDDHSQYRYRYYNQEYQTEGEIYNNDELHGDQQHQQQHDLEFDTQCINNSNNNNKTAYRSYIGTTMSEGQSDNEYRIRDNWKDDSNTNVQPLYSNANYEHENYDNVDISRGRPDNTTTTDLFDDLGYDDDVHSSRWNEIDSSTLQQQNNQFDVDDTTTTDTDGRIDEYFVQQQSIDCYEPDYCHGDNYNNDNHINIHLGEVIPISLPELDETSVGHSSSYNEIDTMDEVDNCKTHSQVVRQIEIAPGKYLPLRGAAETTYAIQCGFCVTISCTICQHDLVCIANCELVLCPNCRVLSPNTIKSLRTTSSSSCSSSSDNNTWNRTIVDDNNDDDAIVRLDIKSGVGLGLEA